MSQSVQFVFRIRTGYRNEVGYAESTVRKQVERAGGSVDSWIGLGGEWEGQALATFPFDGAAKLAMDEIEDLGAIIEFSIVRSDIVATAVAPATEELDVINQVVAANEPGWTAEMPHWEDWSRSTGIQGEFQRVANLNEDPFGVAEVPYDPNGPLSWNWVNAWIWDPDAPSDRGLTAATPKDWTTTGGIGKFIAATVRVGVKLTPLGRGIEIAAAAFTIGKAIYDIRREHRFDRQKYSPPYPTCKYRATMYYPSVRERVWRDSSPRGVMYRHTYQRNEWWSSRF